MSSPLGFEIDAMSDDAEIDCPCLSVTFEAAVTTGAAYSVVATTKVEILLLVVASWIPTPSVSLPGEDPATYRTFCDGVAEIHTPSACLTPLTVK